ncbi:hypothetical protein QTP88_000732 [Uroleucon formosanum]
MIAYITHRLGKKSNLEGNEEFDKFIQNKVEGFSSMLKKKWLDSNRCLTKFLKKNDNWLDLEFKIPLLKKCEELYEPSTSSGRPYELAKSTLYVEGKRAAADLVSQAVAFIIDTHMTKNAYHKTRLGAKKHGADIYHSYDRVRLAKYRCYPENIIISEISASVPLQNLLDPTIKRLWETLDFDDIINYAEEYSELKFICKWGCDGSSGHSEYHQSFHDIETDDTECTQNAITDSSIVLFCIVPLRHTGVIKVSNTRVILWENPTPSSTRYCRPLKFLYAKETKEVTKTEVGRVENEIMELKSVELNIKNSVLCINYTMLMTMVDGKVINTLTESSSRLCYICKCNPTNMNDLDNIKRFVVNEDNVKYGMSSLHAWIKFLELVLHIAYKLESAATTKRTTSEQKKKIEEKKKKIQFRLWNELSIKVDKVVQGRGTSNTGNVARWFFRNTEKVAEITGINLNLLNRFSTILTVISCGYEINYDEFENYAKDTAKLYVKHYNWFRMPPMSSDPLITSLRTQPNKSHTKLPPEAIHLLNIESSELNEIETSDSEISSSYSE